MPNETTRFLRDVIPNKRLHELLPWNWKPAIAAPAA